jgi:hypothetical protein
MPVAAAGLADVGAGDLQPLVLRGCRQHPLEHLAIAGLELGLRLELSPRIRDPTGQRVTNRLQFAEAERARLWRDWGNACVDLDTRKAIGEKRAELGFEAPNLPSQLYSCEPFIAA